MYEQFLHNFKKVKQIILKYVVSNKMVAHRGYVRRAQNYTYIIHPLQRVNSP